MLGQITRRATIVLGLLGLLAGLAVQPQAARSQTANTRDVRQSAIPDFATVAAENRGLTGFYVAGGLGYAFSASRAFSLVDGFACPGIALPGLGPVMVSGSSGCTTSAAIGGLSAHAMFGWNTVIGGRWIAGLELRGRLGSETGSGRLGGTSTVTLAGILPYTNVAAGTYRASLTGGLALTARYGIDIGGVMPFVRGGLGMAHLSERVDFDATGSRACAITGMPPTLACTSGGRVTSQTARWLPSLVLGAGVEVPFGRWFVRAEGELEAAFSPSSNLMRTLAGQAMVDVTGGPTGDPATVAGQAALRSENWIVSRRLMLSGGFRF
ncbi:hypothetical protein [Phreatobacter sp.]|uniref:hypothetical protein n=1 Tax=Phreatobacter sp. TaxID=1966341 RepID=UPI003F730545